MGTASKVKVELSETAEILDLIQTLKDVADNKYFSLIAEKEQFRRFSESFTDFFRMLSFAKVKHPLVANDNPTVGILVITIEGSFLAGFNNNIIRRAMQEKDKHEGANVRFIGVGDKCEDQLSQHTSNLKMFREMEATGYYETAVAIKEYLIDEIMNDRLGKVHICHAYPKNFDTQKYRSNKLLPAQEMIQIQDQFVDAFENTIQESNSESIVEFLANLWVTTRIYEILVDTTIASAAAQSSFLEDRVEKMKKEKQKVQMRYRKARRADIDKALRETFTARSMVAD